jgi:hypothetical protein
MHSETELRAACTELAAEAPSLEPLLDRVVASGRQRRGPSPRLLLPIGATVAIVVTVAVLVSVTWRSGPNSTTATLPPAAANPAGPCAAQATPHFEGVAIAAVPGLAGDDLINTSACSGRRTRTIYTTSGGLAGSLSLFAAGVFDKTLVAGAKHVSGHGISAYSVALPCPDAPGPFSTSCAKPLSLAWEYAPDAWATLTPDRNDAADAMYGSDAVDKQLAIAAAVRPDQPAPMLAPFRLGDLPKQLRAIQATSFPSSPDNSEYGRGASIDVGLPGRGAGCITQSVCLPAVDIDVVNSIDTSIGDGWTGRHTSINGHDALLVDSLPTSGVPTPAGPRLIMAVGHWYLDMAAVDASAGITEDDLIRIAQGITFAPSTDSATWFTVDEAVSR